MAVRLNVGVVLGVGLGVLTVAAQEVTRLDWRAPSGTRIEAWVEGHALVIHVKGFDPRTDFTQRADLGDLDLDAPPRINHTPSCKTTRPKCWLIQGVDANGSEPMRFREGIG